MSLSPAPAVLLPAGYDKTVSIKKVVTGLIEAIALDNGAIDFRPSRALRAKVEAAVLKMHTDLLRGEAMECYTSSSFWCEESLETMAYGEESERGELLGKSEFGAELDAALEEVFDALSDGE